MVRADRGDRRDIRREIDKVAGTAQSSILPRNNMVAMRADCGPGISVVELLRHAAVEQVKMLWQHDPRLHHVQIVYLGKIDSQECRTKHICLLLVVASRQTRSPGLMTVFSKWVASRASTILPYVSFAPAHCLRSGAKIGGYPRYPGQS
jgi:hypothetical protein